MPVRAVEAAGGAGQRQLPVPRRRARAARRQRRRRGARVPPVAARPGRSTRATACRRSVTSSSSTTTTATPTTRSSCAAHAPAPRTERSGDDLLLWYTGGTTGLPKGVLWHQGTLLGYGLIAAYALQGETPTDSIDQLVDDVRRWRARGTPLVSLLTTPLVHATAVHQANTAFAVGGTIVLLERGHTDGDTICATIQRERPSVLEIVGDVLMRRIARALDAADARGEPYDLSSLQRIHNSGAMVSAPLKDALLSRGTMHVYDSLGSSEAVGFGVALTTAAGQGETARFTLGPNAAPPRRRRPRRRARLRRGRCPRGAHLVRDRLLQGPGPQRGHVPRDRRQHVRDPRRPGDARRRRHPRAPRARLELHQLRRREDLARGGRGGAEGAPRR